MHLTALLIQGELKWLEICTSVRRVTEGLLLRHTAAAPVVVFCSENDIWHLVRSDLRLDGEWLFAEVALETTCIVISPELLD